jgi:hypothetical protein
MTFRIRRREFIAGLGAGFIAAPAIVRAEGQPVVIRAGALKLIHSIAPYFYEQFVPAGYKVEVLPFETPTECKNAVVTTPRPGDVRGLAGDRSPLAPGLKHMSAANPEDIAFACLA